MNFNLNLLAQIVGNNFGINVVQGSGFAIAKDGKGLTLYVPPMSIGNEEDAMILRGGLCHEAVGHGRHTDFSAKRGPTPLHLSIENVLEDARIEKAAWKIYPKSRRMLEESMAAMARRNKIVRASNQNSPAGKASAAVLLRLLVEELGYCKKLIDWKEDWAAAVQCFGNETMNKVWTEAVSGYQVSSTEEVIKAAAKIVKLLQKGFEDQQQQQQQPEQQKGESGESGDAQSGGGDSGDGQDQDQQGGSSQGGGENGEDGQGQGASGGGQDDAKGKENGQGQGNGDGNGGNQSQGKDEGGSSQGAGRGSGRAPTPLDTNAVKPAEFDRGDALKGQLPVNHNSMRDIGSGKAHAPGTFIPSGDSKTAAQRLKSSLAQRLLAIVEDEDDDLVEHGVLASHRLVDARMGDRYVFSEPGKPGERLDTAFSLLIDMSGSMAGVADRACLTATWAIGDTLNGYNGMGLSFTVSSFNGRLYEMKDWNEPWKRGECLSSYKASGSTHTYGAVKNRLEHLVKRPEPRKVLYLISDDDIGDLSSLVNSANEMGCEVVVMMIGDQSMKPHAPYLKRFTAVRPGNIAQEMLKTVISLF